MSLEIFHVDAFTDQPFAGNPAAVCILPAAPKVEWMQKIAMEMNLSETAFTWKTPRGFHLKWFTPTEEVPLCGHATLATAHVLWEAGVSLNETLLFETLSGDLTAKKHQDWIELDFPAHRPSPIPTPAGLYAALGIRGTPPCFRAKLYTLIEVESAETVRTLKPNLRPEHFQNTNGFIITAKSDTKEFDFISRFFNCHEGVSEDPVTGSAHCCLGPYWETRLGKKAFIAYQASARGGVLHVMNNGERVLLLGQALTVLRGQLMHIVTKEH